MGYSPSNHMVLSPPLNARRYSCYISLQMLDTGFYPVWIVAPSQPPHVAASNIQTSIARQKTPQDRLEMSYFLPLKLPLILYLTKTYWPFVIKQERSRINTLSSH